MLHQNEEVWIVGSIFCWRLEIFVVVGWGDVGVVVVVGLVLDILLIVLSPQYLHT